MGKAFRSRSADYGDYVLSGNTASSPARRVAQAIDGLRHGWPLAVDGAPLLLPLETAIESDASAKLLLISSARAATLKLGNQAVAASGAARPDAPVLIRAAAPLNLASALPIADPSMDLEAPLKGPFKAQELQWETAAKAALELARLAGILPAFLVDPATMSEPVAVSPDDLSAWKDSDVMTIATRAKLPVSASDTGEIIAFRKENDTREHVALVIGQQNSDKTPLVRLHSECLTGDILGSLKCDCGPQLDAALSAMADEADAGGWGILLYLRQEGRGIGLINKLRAYALQDSGFDTLEANRRLGLPEEARDFSIAAQMLRLLGTQSVRLMTNNPAKVDALTGEGITIAERVPHQLPDNPHNARYLATKRDEAGHLLI